MSRRDALARMIAEARRVVAFTGAGLSTDSGIPDFRSPGGVWSRMRPIQYAAFLADEDMRREAWRRAFTGAAGWTGATPNGAHHVLARWVAEGRVSAVITQNVDNLHQASGMPPDKLIELHGNASHATCIDCGLRHELKDLEAPFLERDVIPTCRACGGLVKVATISFGQPMPRAAMDRATQASLECDLFLVLGSSLVVVPAASLPLVAKQNGATLAILNRDPTPLDGKADLVLHEEIGPALAHAGALLDADQD